MNPIEVKFDENGDKYWTDGKKVVYEKTVKQLLQEMADADEKFWKHTAELHRIDPRFGK